jgi:flagellar basal body-associated protein FliL
MEGFKLKRKPLVALIVIIVLGLCVFVTWFYSKTADSATFPGFLKILKQNGYKVNDVTKDYEKEYSPNKRLPNNHKVISVDGKNIFILIETNETVNSTIEKQMSVIQNPLIDFAGTPHLYRKGNLVVLYQGIYEVDDSKLLSTLEDVLGKPLIN